MKRAFSLLLGWLLLAPLLAAATAPPSLPARPTPFHFVNDYAKLLSEADASTLDKGLRRYADANGAQLVVVTVDKLDGLQASAYARALGQAWGVGQRGQNNGVVVLVAAQERQVAIQPGTGLKAALPASLTDRVIRQNFGPDFKQGNYFRGLRSGLNVLMQAASPGSAPTPGTGPAAAGAAVAPATADAQDPSPLSDETAALPAPTSVMPPAAASEPAPGGGIGWGGILLGVAVVGGGLWLLSSLLRKRQAANRPAPPDFYGQGTGPGRPGPGGPNPGGFNSGGYPNGGYPAGGSNNGGSGGSGFGTIAATAAAAGAAAYIGSRMAQGSPHSDTSYAAGSPDHNSYGAGGAGSAAGPGAAADYFGTPADSGSSPAPDYFSDAADNNTDYFSDDSSYDDSSSGNSGGSFDDDSSSGSSGSW